MITQRTCWGGASKAAAIAGKAMLTIESSDTTNAPAAAISRPISPLGIPRMMTRACGRRAIRGTSCPWRSRRARPRKSGTPSPRNRPARGGRHGRHDGRDKAPRRHARGHEGAREGDAARDRRAALPLRRRGVGRGGEDRRGPSRALRRPRHGEIPRARAEEGWRLMPIQINKGVVGKEFPPYVVTVERGKIKEFARAIGDLNPFYLDDRVGQASEWGDVIAPPTFAVTFRDRKSTRLNSSHLVLSYAVFCSK